MRKLRNGAAVLAGARKNTGRAGAGLAGSDLLLGNVYMVASLDAGS